MKVEDERGEGGSHRDSETFRNCACCRQRSAQCSITYVPFQTFLFRTLKTNHWVPTENVGFLAIRRHDGSKHTGYQSTSGVILGLAPESQGLTKRFKGCGSLVRYAIGYHIIGKQVLKYAGFEHCAADEHGRAI